MTEPRQSDVLCEVRLLAGDDNGGPFMEATIGLAKDPEAITDEEMAQHREAAREVYRKAFGEEPQAVIVTVAEVAE